MVTIYQADSESFQNKKDLRDLIEKLPNSMQKRALRYKFEKDAYNFAMGRLLLKKGLVAHGLGNQFENIEYQKSGKPFLKDVFFNISHTENLVVCAITTDGEIGIDVEKVKQITLDDFKTWFTSKEWAIIYNAPSPIKTFYWFWTRKESIIKALGVNLSDLHKIELDASKNHFIKNGKKRWLKDLDFGPGYFGALCSEIEVKEIRIG